MKNLDSRLLFIFITVLVDVIGIGIIVPVVPELLKQLGYPDLNEAAAMGGWLMAIFAIFQFLFAPIMGELSDQYGRRPVLLLSLLGLSIDFLLHAFATSITWLFAARVLAGITGASHSVAQAYIADISSAKDKAKNFGLIGAAFGLGFIIGPAIGGIFGKIDVRLPFYIAAGLSFANFVFGYFFVPESLSKANRRKVNYSKMIPAVSLINIGKYKSLGALLIGLFLAHMAGQSLPSTWTYFTMEKYGWDEAEVGYSLSAVGICVALVQGLLIGVLVKKWGEKKVILIGYVFWTIGMFLFALASTPLLLYLFIIPYSIGGIAGATLQGLISNNVSEKEQGNLQGSITSMVSVTTILGPLLATQVFFRFADKTSDLYFPGAPYVTSALIFLIGLVIVYLGLPKVGNKVDDLFDEA